MPNQTHTPSRGLTLLDELAPDRPGTSPELMRIVRGLHALERTTGRPAADALAQLAAADPAARVAMLSNKQLSDAIDQEMTKHPDGSPYATALIDEYESRDPSEVLLVELEPHLPATSGLTGRDL